MSPHSAILPEPDAAALAHSQLLLGHVQAIIRANGGPISFRQFMQEVLYAPGLGYYTAGSHKFGAAGDFITAPEISTLFSHTLAQALAPVLPRLDEANILEVGAGRGVMAAEILRHLERQDSLPEHYYILELSADLRERQQATLAQQLPHLLERVVWLEQLPQAFSGVVLANEVLDAMPVNLFTIRGGQVRERYIDWQDGHLVWCEGEPSDERIGVRISAIEQALGQPLAEGYSSEINLLAEDWLATLGQHLQQGLVLLIDYGFPRHEYYHPQRQAGTLMCHYRHHAHDDPFQYLGLQDITAHVDFTAMAEAAHTAGLQICGYTNQGNFLIGSGLAELVGVSEDMSEQVRLAGEIKKLTMPHEMGELFKVIGLDKGLDIHLPGFALRDLRNSL